MTTRIRVKIRGNEVIVIKDYFNNDGHISEKYQLTDAGDWVKVEPGRKQQPLSSENVMFYSQDWLIE